MFMLGLFIFKTMEQSRRIGGRQSETFFSFGGNYLDRLDFYW